MEVNLSSELQQYIKRRAKETGCHDESEFISQLIEADRQTNPCNQDSEKTVGQQLKEFSQSNILGDDLTVKDLINKGRKY